jgi:hypothetical protein
MSEDLYLTKFEELIYNTYLKASRQRLSQPYKLRKNFVNLDAVKINCLKKLSLFFNKFKHINLDDFFIAPYKVYKDEEYFDLKYYTTLKATKAYTMYQRQLEDLDPDNADQLKNIQRSLIFINNFCKEQKINLKDYLNHKHNLMPSCILHLKEHKVNLYTLLGFTHFSNLLKSIDGELAKFTIGEETYNKLDIFRTKLFNSTKALILVQKGLNKINENLQEKA